MSLEHLKVTFFGTLRWDDGDLVEGSCQLIPSVPATEIEGVLVSLEEVELKLVDGSFVAKVLPTTLGSEPWHYVFQTPANAYAVTLPDGGGPYNIAQLVKQ